ncbi:MAG: peptidoglycan DD-metalloendopeptidase family protein [Deltaproteobacteria bacterium]|nr:peptidoglycan DD-metalloendopeptidase family protein [Deltaproteobacteria bacterium]
MIVKRGGVYYISSREQPQSNQADRHTPSLRWLPFTPQARPTFPGVKGSISETDQPHNLRPRLIKAVTRLDSRRNLKATSAKGVPDLSQLRLKKAYDLQVGNASDPQENIWTAPRYLGRLWAKTGCRSPLALAAYNPGSRRPDLQQNLPPIQEIQALVRDVCKNFLTYAQAVPPGADFLADSNPLSYCFPVAPPYSFRDTWGDWRSGGRFHHAVDIVACDGTPVYAITSGVIHTLATWNGAGISLLLRGQDGKGYGYMHLQEYAEGIVEGKTVHKGELIAYVGHTGIKRDAAHLHLQVYADDSFDRDKLVNPYGLLVQLSHGKGVTDWSSPTMARRQIPAAEVVDFGPVTLSGSVPRRYQASQHKIVDASTWLPNTY